MSTTMKKILLVTGAVFAVVALIVGVMYFVNKPKTVVKLPKPSPIVMVSPSPEESAEPVEINVVEESIAACSQTFTVACASAPPSTSPSPSPSPSASSTVSPTPSPSSSAPVYPSPSPSTPPSASLSCVSKKIYEDDERNRAGFYYLEKEIVDTNTLQNGQVIVYNVTTKNDGGNSAPDTTITDKLSSNLTYVDADSGCTYDSSTRTVTCTIGTLAPNSEAQRSLRVKVGVSGTTAVANTAEVSSTNGQRDSCSIEIDATGIVVVPPSDAPTALPVAGVFEVTAGTVGIGLILLILGGLGLLLI